MTIEMMRKYVTDVYPGKAWSDRVKHMPASQVQAIYYRFVKEGKIK